MKFQNCFSELLLPASSIHSYCTRWASQENYYRPFAGTNYGKFSIKFFASQLWETIPVSLKLLSFKILKRNIRNFYFVIKSSLLF